MEIKSVRIKFEKLLHDTGRAIYVRIDNEDHWLGYFMFKTLVVNNKLGGNLIIQTKYCIEKGIYYDESNASEFIKRHIPEKVNKKAEINESLIR